MSGLTSVESPAARRKGGDQGRVGLAEGIDGPQGQLGRVGGRRRDRASAGGQDVAAPLTVEERGQKRLEVDVPAAGCADQLRGPRRGGVDVEPGQGGDRRGSVYRPAGRAGQGLDLRSPRLAADRGQGVERSPRSASSAAGETANRLSASAAASSFQRPASRTAAFSSARSGRGEAGSKQRDQLVEVLGRPQLRGSTRLRPARRGP